MKLSELNKDQQGYFCNLLHSKSGFSHSYCRALVNFRSDTTIQEHFKDAGKTARSANYWAKKIINYQVDHHQILIQEKRREIARTLILGLAGLDLKESIELLGIVRDDIDFQLKLYKVSPEESNAN